MSMLRRYSLTTALLALAVTAPAHAQTFASWDFDDVVAGQATPFAQTKNGVTGTFSAAVGPADGFFVGGSFFELLSGNVLLSANVGSNDLDIAFSSAVNELDVTFALNTGDVGTAFTVQTFLGLNSVSTLNGFGALASSGFVEGLFATTGALFDRVVISSVAPDLAIDNLSIRTAAVPEPASALLMLIGLGALGATARRRPSGSAA